MLFFGAGLPQIAKLTGKTKSYSERLFEFPEVDKLDRKSAIKALVIPVNSAGLNYDKDALDLILEETDRYPFFLQLWGSHIWEVAESSPFTKNDAILASERAIEALDRGFFRVRFDRLTERQREYVYAMASADTLPAKSVSLALEIGLTVNKAAPVRDELIKKGIAYSPGWGLITFTVPGFKEFLIRTMS